MEGSTAKLTFGLVLVSWEMFLMLIAVYYSVLSLYIDKRRGVQGNTSMRSREFPRAQPEGTPMTECWYFPVFPDSSQGTDIIQFIKVMKLRP